MQMLGTIGTFMILLGGIVTAATGLLGWKKGNIKMFCGVREVKVDVDKYVKFMGIANISFGMFYVAMGILGCFFEASAIFIFLGYILNLTFYVHAEKKYKIVK